MEKPNPMNRREFVALVGVGGAMACAPEILGTATDQEMTPAQAYPLVGSFLTKREET